MTSRRQLIPTRIVLIAVAGQTPAIVTETLWALEQRCGVLVDEIRIITTVPGAEAVTRELLGLDGAFERYCSDYGVPAGRIAFSPSHLYVLKDAHGAALQDIRNTEDNRITANTIFSLLRDWCSRPNEILHSNCRTGRTQGSEVCMRREGMLETSKIGKFTIKIRAVDDLYSPAYKGSTSVAGSGARCDA